MPKLLQIDSCLGVLSTGRISEGIAKVAMSQGWDCYIAHGARYVGKTIQHSYQIETKYGEYIHYAKSLLFDEHGLGSTLSTKRLIKKIKEIKPDVIQLHCIHGYYLNYKVLFEYLAGTNVPVVWTQHDCWAFTGHCAYFGFANCEKWKSECSNCPLSYSYPKAYVDCSRRNYLLKKKLFTSVKDLTIVSVSKWLDNIVNESFLNIYPHRVIYNGIDTEKFRPCDVIIRDKYGITTPHFLLAVASAWSDNKGLNDYMCLCELLPDDYCIVMVGVDDNTRKKLPSKIIAISRTDSKRELAMLYSNADFVTSLSYCETMGLTVVEGLACGTPAIVYDNTAQPEIASGGVGYVITTGDYRQIPDILLKDRNMSLEERDLRGQTCIKRAKQLFNDAKQYEQYVGLYSDLINRSKPGGGGINCPSFHMEPTEGVE